MNPAHMLVDVRRQCAGAATEHPPLIKLNVAGGRSSRILDQLELDGGARSHHAIAHAGNGSEVEQEWLTINLRFDLHDPGAGVEPGNNSLLDRQSDHTKRWRAALSSAPHCPSGACSSRPMSLHSPCTL